MRTIGLLEEDHPVVLTYRKMAGIHFTPERTLDPARGGQAWIQWPDGHEEIVTFEPDVRRGVRHDMGREYEVPVYVPRLRVHVHGLPVWVELSTVLVGWIQQS